MVPRLLAVLVFLVLSGCASTPGGMTGTAPMPEAPTDSLEAATESVTEVRQSRPPERPARASAEEVSWKGATIGGLCVEIPVGCLGMTQYGKEEQRIRVERAGTVRLTITWDAVDPKTETLRVTAAQAEATGPSPLVLDLATDQDFTVRVESLGDGPLMDRPQQRFDGWAGFNV